MSVHFLPLSLLVSGGSNHSDFVESNQEKCGQAAEVASHLEFKTKVFKTGKHFQDCVLMSTFFIAIFSICIVIQQGNK